MKIVALKEKAKHETRVAITPEVAGLLVKKGYAVTVEKDIGLQAGFLDEEYVALGAKISSVPLEIISDAEIILKVQPSSVTDKYGELEFAKKGAIIVGLLSPYLNHEYIKAAAKKTLQLLLWNLCRELLKLKIWTLYLLKVT